MINPIKIIVVFFKSFTSVSVIKGSYMSNKMWGGRFETGPSIIMEEINVSIDFDKNLSHLSLPMEHRRDFYLVFKETINNLAKYADCKEAKISLTETDGTLVLIIKDNGIGFDPLSINDRNGQKTMRQRAERLNAELKIASALGEGTTVELRLPLV